MNLIKLQKPFQGLRKVFNPFKQAAKDAITSMYPFGDARPVRVNTKNTEKFASTCCAMAIYSMTNNTSIEEIQYIIERQRKESEIFWDTSSRASGEMNLVVITTPTEIQLEENLKSCGFVCIKDNLKRRHGYPAGNLKMWMYVIPD